MRGGRYNSQSRVSESTRREVFGDELIHNLSLGVTLWMIRRGGGVPILRSSYASFAQNPYHVSDDFKRKTITTNPTIKGSIADSSSLLVGEGEDFRVLMKGICDAQNIFLAGFRCFERTKEIRVDTLVRRGALRKRVKNVRFRVIICAYKLTTLTGQEVSGDVGVHTGPVI